MMQPTSDEVQGLRRCVRDLVALSTLPAVWGNADSLSIGRSLAEVLLRILSVDFLYVRLHNRAGGAAVEAVRTRQRTESVGRAHEIGLALAPWLHFDPADADPLIPNPVGEGTLRLVVLPIGHGQDFGLLAAGCGRSDFPSDNERLLLSVAVNQAAGLLQRKEAEEALAKQSEWLRVTLASIGDAVITTDTEGRVTSLNPIAESLTGWSQAEAQGMPLEHVFVIVNELGRQPVENPVTKALREGQIVGLTNHTVLIARDGTERAIDDSAAPIRDGQGHILGAVLIFRDVTERRRAEEALHEADRRKDEFLATLAHELRNPLAPLRNALQILKYSPLDAAVERSREMMERQVQHLIRLVDDLLDVSRVMRGKITLHRERVELASIVARAVETVQPFLEAQQHELTITLPSESLLVHADPVRLCQVIGNLLTNAAKYTEPGGRIGVTAQRDGEEVIVRVRDSGIGIAPDMLPHVFELFVQAEPSATRSQGGLGIGLTLVKNLVEMHHGTIEAHSDGLRQGSEFVLRLPLALRLEETDGQDNGKPADAVPCLGHRLLVVDDNRDAADSLGILLRLQGHEVQVVHDGSTALELVKSYRPDLILLDIGMPGMDGYEVARRLRRQPGLEHVQLAALTGWGQPDDRRRTKEAGFDHHLTKPVELDILAKLLAELQPATA